jgi:hypothetical protein
MGIWRRFMGHAVGWGTFFPKRDVFAESRRPGSAPGLLSSLHHEAGPKAHYTTGPALPLTWLNHPAYRLWCCATRRCAAQHKHTMRQLQWRCVTRHVGRGVRCRLVSKIAAIDPATASCSALVRCWCGVALICMAIGST